jgi:hypothetical protein
MQIKKILIQLFPPLLVSIAKKNQNLFFQKPNNEDDPNILFDGDDELFKKLILSIKVYGEYGCGKSTSFVLHNTNAKVLSVDSSKVWIDRIIATAIDKSRLDCLWVDLGEIGDWGTPINYKMRKNIPDYIKSIWQRSEKPELVLIDGRFRVACFLYSLLHAKPGSILVFDDYICRPKYHLIEEFVSLQSVCGRQGIFKVPSDINRNEIEKELAKFTYVMH